MPNQLILQIIQYIEKHRLIKSGDTIIIGLSGGPDSVFLLHMLKFLQAEYNLKLIAAHLDHEWRAESAQDAQFCQELAQKLELPLVLEKASHIKITRKTKSLEERGRLLRRCFFEQVARNYTADSIALGHHADDQEETFFIRLIRGATVTGLACMRPKTGLYIRPLLELFKSQILAYLQSQNILFVTDITNQSEQFLRNNIRKSVIPALRLCDSRFDANLLKTIEHMQKTESFLDDLAKKYLEKISQVQNNCLALTITQLEALHLFITKRILILWLCHAQVPFTLSDSLLDEIVRFFKNSKAVTHDIGQNWHITKKNGLASISKK